MQLTNEELKKIKFFIKKLDCAINQAKVRGWDLTGGIAAPCRFYWNLYVVDGRWVFDQYVGEGQKKYTNPIAFCLEGKMASKKIQEYRVEYATELFGLQIKCFNRGFDEYINQSNIYHYNIPGARIEDHIMTDIEKCVFNLGAHYHNICFNTNLQPSLPKTLKQFIQSDNILWQN